MGLGRMIDRFVEQAPAAVMVRGVLGYALDGDRLDAIFRETAERQYERELLFSSCADLMALVVCTIQPSVNAAYRARKDELLVSVKSVYSKLAGIEPAVSERMVRDTGETLAAVVELLDDAPPSMRGPLPGREVRILDGNHIAGTQHRIAELRTTGAAALPGQAIAVLDPGRGLIVDVVTCEDGHSNERVMYPAVLERVGAGECWIGDSNFCTLDLMFGIDRRGADFVFRHHGNLKGELRGRRRRVGRGETGIVHEQTLAITHAEHGEMLVRRITIVRDEPTSKGETEVHVLTNLPRTVRANRVAEAYRDRWSIETAFAELATTLRSEVDTLGYPDAALFAFCIALVLANVLSVVKAALRTAAPKRTRRSLKLSTYYLADEVAGTWRGMAIAIPDEDWRERFAQLTPAALARRLRSLARHVDLRRYRTNKWSPKQPRPKRTSGHRGRHVSTKRVLDGRKHGC